ncbi:tRNA (N6-threonylcarbamoyladenosine(37)-N6)-methyltransferase TrmO [bacterium]|nr:tRNA (N6-threonylcarbamoyladenosine(37)-N6)-methyltransferase TrmO [bacterium]
MIKEVTLYPIGYVQSPRKKHQDDEWGNIISKIEIDKKYGVDSLQGMDSFSHAEIVFYMDRVLPDKIITGTRHPRNNPNHPKVGVFAQRVKNRPNQIGVSTVKILKLEGNILTVQSLDAIDGTPVLDIKPFFSEMRPNEGIRSPKWVKDIMKNYY